jgi:multisubunit Na+/H+ antiporter MnhB subunit
VKDPVHLFETGARVAFMTIAVVLVLFAISMTVYSIGQTVYALIYWDNFGFAVLRGVGYIVISIAVKCARPEKRAAA